MVGNGAIGDFRDEAERTLRTDHQMLEDFERILEIDEGVERIAHRILDREFAAYALCERLVVARLATKRGEPFQADPRARRAKARRLAASAVSRTAPSASTIRMDCSVR